MSARRACLSHMLLINVVANRQILKLSNSETILDAQHESSYAAHHARSPNLMRLSVFQRLQTSRFSIEEGASRIASTYRMHRTTKHDLWGMR